MQHQTWASTIQFAPKTRLSESNITSDSVPEGCFYKAAWAATGWESRIIRKVTNQGLCAQCLQDGHLNLESQDYFMKIFNKSIIMRNVTATIAATAAAVGNMS